VAAVAGEAREALVPAGEVRLAAEEGALAEARRRVHNLPLAWHTLRAQAI